MRSVAAEIRILAAETCNLAAEIHFLAAQIRILAAEIRMVAGSLGFMRPSSEAFNFKVAGTHIPDPGVHAIEFKFQVPSSVGFVIQVRNSMRERPS